MSRLIGNLWEFLKQQTRMTTAPASGRIVVWTLLALAGLRLAVFLLNFVLWQLKCRRVARQFPGPPKHWLYGNTKTTQAETEGFGQCFSYWVGPLKMMLVCFDPEIVRRILSQTVPKDEFFYRLMRPWLGDGLLLSKGPKWQRNRKLLTSAFHLETLKPYVGIFSESANVLMEKVVTIGPDASVELFEHIGLLALDNILRCSIGYHSNCQVAREPPPYIKAVGELLELIHDRGNIPLYQSDIVYYLTPSGQRFRRALKLVHSFAENIIKDRRAKLRNENPSHQGRSKGHYDFLDIMLKAKDESGNGLSDAEIRQEVDTFLVGGHDTTASGICWTLCHLAKHPEYQDRCRREVTELLQGRTKMTWYDVNNLPFITMCIKESLRCVPPAPYIFRKLSQPLTLPDGRTVPAGLTVLPALVRLHWNTSIWTNPHVYDPSRFSPENSKNRHTHAFMPFSAGPRNCIGQNFAMAEMKVVVALILQRFKLKLDDTKPTPVIKHRITLKSEKGIWLKFQSVSMDE